MADYIIDGSVLTDIANAIRSKTGGNDLFTPETMAAKVASMSTEYESFVKGIVDRTCNNIVIPDGVTTIGDYAFYNCTELALISMPNSIAHIGQKAFWTCSKLALKSLPDGIKTVATGAFQNCTSFTEMTFPASLEAIGADVFWACAALKTVTFKGTPTSLDTRAFVGCNGLVTINVPWAEGEVANAPWSATKATINYNYNGGEA